MANPDILNAQFLEIVNNQLLANDPPETKSNYDRLIRSGFTEMDAKLLIAQCVAVEIFNVMKHKTPFDSVRYTNHLNNLPNEPF